MAKLPLLLLAALSIGAQIDGPSTPLTLDIRVFRGAVEVTRESTVAIYRIGERTQGRRLSLAESGAYRVGLRTGAYDVQVLHEQAGTVLDQAWSTLRMHVDGAREGEPQLEVLNFDKTYGALAVRPKGQPSTGAGTWSARLVTSDGREVARGVAAGGAVVLVAPAGVYDVIVDQPGGSQRLADVAIRPSLTARKAF